MDDEQIMTLEAFADTIIPGNKRFAGDEAIAGASADPGAVEAGALELLQTSATGVSAGLVPLAGTLNAHAARYAIAHGVALGDGVPAFVGLPFAHRTALVALLTTPGHPEKDGWVSLALFCNMAYDSAAHLPTGAAMAEGHPGLAAMGLARHDADGYQRFDRHSYGRPLAKTHPNTAPSGSPA